MAGAISPSLYTVWLWLFWAAVLWGFGMRYAMLAGHLAARALIERTPEKYDRLWKGPFGETLRGGIVNRSRLRSSATMAAAGFLHCLIAALMFAIGSAATRA